MISADFMAGNRSKPRGDEDVVCVPEIDIKQEDEDDLDEENNHLRIIITDEEDFTDLIKSEPSMSEPSVDEKDAEASHEGSRRCRRRRKKCTLTEDQPDQLPDPIIRSCRKRTVKLVQLYSCEVCFASFKTRKELKAHEVEHVDERIPDLKEPKPRSRKKKNLSKGLTRKLKYYPTFCGKYLTNCRADSRQVSKRKVAINTKTKSISENSNTVDETIESVISDFNPSVVSGTKKTEQVKSLVRSKRVSSVSNNFDHHVESGKKKRQVKSLLRSRHVSSVSNNFDLRVESVAEKAQQVEAPVRIKRKIVPNRKYASEWYTTDSDFDFDCLVKKGNIEMTLGEITSNMMAISVITPDDVHKAESVASRVVNNTGNCTPKVITKPLTMAHNKHRKHGSATRERDPKPKLKILEFNEKDVIRTRPRTKNVYRIRPRANDVSPALFPNIPLEKTLVAPASAAVEEKPSHVCDMCSKTFFSREELLSHVIVHI